jgi:CheY-like chemotaxis protein
MTPLKTRISSRRGSPDRAQRSEDRPQPRADLEVVAEATDGDEAIARALIEDVHLAILDISMPRKSGLQAAREITERKPEVRVLMLSMHDNEQFCLSHPRRRVRLRAQEFRRSQPGRGLPRHDARLAIPVPGGIQALMREYLERVRIGEAMHGDLLTPREEEILKLVAEAHTNGEIGALLHPKRPRRAAHRAGHRMRPKRHKAASMSPYPLPRTLVRLGAIRMTNHGEIPLCEYGNALGQHQLYAVLDELTLTYRVLLREPDGRTRDVRQFVSSRGEARRWAAHYRNTQLLAGSNPAPGSRGIPHPSATRS